MRQCSRCNDTWDTDSDFFLFLNHGALLNLASTLFLGHNRDTDSDFFFLSDHFTDHFLDRALLLGHDRNTHSDFFFLFDGTSARNLATHLLLGHDGLAFRDRATFLHKGGAFLHFWLTATSVATTSIAGRSLAALGKKKRNEGG